MAKQATCHTCVYAHWDRAAVDAEPVVGVCGPADVREPAGLVRADERVSRAARSAGTTGPGRLCPGRRRQDDPAGRGLVRLCGRRGLRLAQPMALASVRRYAGRREKGKTIFMHRQIMQPPKGKDRGPHQWQRLDNTRANLRNITPRQNVHNKGKCIGNFHLQGRQLRQEASSLVSGYPLRQRNLFRAASTPRWRRRGRMISRRPGCLGSSPG